MERLPRRDANRLDQRPDRSTPPGRQFAATTRELRVHDNRPLRAAINRPPSNIGVAASHLPRPQPAQPSLTRRGSVGDPNRMHQPDASARATQAAPIMSRSLDDGQFMLIIASIVVAFLLGRASVAPSISAEPDVRATSDGAASAKNVRICPSHRMNSTWKPSDKACDACEALRMDHNSVRAGREPWANWHKPRAIQDGTRNWPRQRPATVSQVGPLVAANLRVQRANPLG